MRSISRAFVLAGLLASCTHSTLRAQRIVLDPGRLQNQILWTAAEEAKLKELGAVETKQREILKKETAWKQAVGPPVANTVRASPAPAPAAAPSPGAKLLAALAGSDTPYGRFANAELASRATTAALDAQARTFAGDNRELNLSEWQHVQQQRAALTNQTLLVTATRHDDAARAGTFLRVQATRQRVDAAEAARAKSILRANFSP